MLQPRIFALFLTFLFFLNVISGDKFNFSPRRRRQNGEDVTTVLLVDSHGRSTFGRFLSVKPDLGLLTSTARTFIQEGVTTEYATQVLGTTLDNGRLYAHLLTKSSRVLYDNDAPTRSHLDASKKWSLDNHLVGKSNNFVKNTDYISPNQVDNPFIVFPTIKPGQYLTKPSKESYEEELLQSPSNNPRVPFAQEEVKKDVKIYGQNNIKVFQINPQVKNIDSTNSKENSEENDIIKKDEFTPSKVKEWDNIPTFTVRNEFSPSGFSFLGDLPDFDSNTERSKPTTAAERRAKLLFRGGIPNKHDLKTVTYTGFADFTTTVGDTVIIFTPQTAEPPKQNNAHVTKIKGEATIAPTKSLHEPPVFTKIKTFLNHKPGVVTETVEGHKLTMQTVLPTLIVDPGNRQPKQENLENLKKEDLETPEIKSPSQITESPISFSSNVIEPSEQQTPMLSTPSPEEVAKIFADLQAKLSLQATDPLQTPSTKILETALNVPKSFGGATTIFFDDNPFEQNTASLSIPEKTTQKEEELTTTESEEVLEKQTTENIYTTTNTEDPTTNEIITTTEEEPTTDNIETKCKNGEKIVPTSVYKTLTYLTTFYIPNGDETSTSVKSNKVVSTEIGFETQKCDEIDPSLPVTTVQSTEITTTESQSEEDTTIPIAQEIVTEAEPTTEDNTTTQQITTQQIEVETVPNEITTERRHVTESEPETTEMTTENGEEIELIFKTLYTTYTYLTTYFQESTSSIASRKVVITNVITSTIDPTSQMSDDVSSLMSADFKTKPVTFEDFDNFAPSGVGIGRPTELPSIDSINNMNDNEQRPTPALSDENIQQTANAIKTYYTTYTYFTTIFVDGETEISSRTEVYTNYVTPTTNPIDNIQPTMIGNLEDEIKNKIMALNIDASNVYNSTINRQKSDSYEVVDNIDNDILATIAKEPNYSTLQRTTTEDSSENDLLDLSGFEAISTMVTDVRSSTSEGEKRIIDNVDNRNVLDDQIVSESNNESEIIPSPTLLLQTSYTTFTYFTTMYQGTTSSNVVSRLETITNIVTETITPTRSLSPEDLSLPITYFTTFTYWTTLYKDGTTKITSREETVSNVVTPTPLQATIAQSIQPTSVPSEDIKPTVNLNIEPSKEITDDSTTYYTTYTYYTTSYVGNSTVLNSRLETVTNIVNKSKEIDSNQLGRAIDHGSVNNLDNEIKTKLVPIDEKTVKSTGLLSTVQSTLENDGTKTIFSTDVYGTFIDGLYAKVLESTSFLITPTVEPSPVQETLKPTGVVSINQGKIVDADEISTLFYTTKAIGTYIDNLYAQVIDSTSSLKVDEDKKALQTEPSSGHRTGLVRLIEGAIIHNHTTTFYQSKVLGTLIDGRYAQIIESTSSFIVDKIEPSVSIKPDEIAPTPTKALEQIDATNLPISPSPVVIEGSISDSPKQDDENSTEEEDEENSTEDNDGNSRVKSRLTFQSRKRTFTPVIRPFISRSKPSFAPKRKGPKPSSATTITRSDFTPTVTAIPATKSGNRFGGRKSSSSINTGPTASGSRRFSRPKSSSAISVNPSSSFQPSRGRSSSRIQPSLSSFGSSSRRGGFRSSSASSIPPRPSSVFNPNNRFRVRPTIASNLNRGGNSNVVTLPSTISDEENDLTTAITDNPTGEEAETTTADTTLRRSQNPLLRFRRPPLSRPSTTARSTTKSGGRSSNSARNGNKVTTVTPKPKATLRPNLIQSRPRPGNSLFPRRNIFTSTTTTEAPEEEEEDLEGEEESEEVEDDTEFEGSDTNSETVEAPPKKTYGGVQIKPFSGLRRRTKRQTYSRYRRPLGKTTTTSTTPEPEPETEAPKTRSRFLPRGRGRNDTRTTPGPRISPSRPNLSPGRSQFTLRDTGGSSRSNFRRPTTSGSSTVRRPTTRPSNSRSKQDIGGYNNYNNNNARKPTRSRSKTSRRGPTRGKINSSEYESNFVLPGSDGTITVTHQIPTEVTIPIVNGKVTEYRNIITAKLSTEVLGPKQYSTTINPFGKDITVLLSESTGFAANGAKQVTKYTLNENPTTAVIFTPTYIRGRKTSFSHVIPSTVYLVEPIVNTISPGVPQAPLANILLSQLLLGNPIQQPNGILNLQNPATPAIPTTEFQTRTTTYVTTVTSETSTVIPLTFRGKEILTTIIDTSVNVVTATEFITDTIVVTPTVAAQNNQLNSLLVPLLLQQQQQGIANPLLQQQGLFQSPAGVINTNEDLFKKSLFQDQEQQNLDIYDKLNEESEDYQNVEDITDPPKRKTNKKKLRKPTPAEGGNEKETSVITLYVSGRTPGEFSTVLSTILVGDDNKQKREAIYIPVQQSKSYDDLVISTLEYVNSYVSSGLKDILVESSESSLPTDSLESIIGDVSKHTVITESPLLEIKPSKLKNSASKKYQIIYEKSSKNKAGNFLAL